jgi:hypothetical protein
MRTAIAAFLALGILPTAGPALAQPATVYPRPSGAKEWGWAVLEHGSTVVVGARVADVGGVADAGAVYVLDAASGAVLRTISSPTPATFDGFGTALALDGDLLLVGASSDDTAGPDAGAAYLFDLQTGSLLQTFLNPTPGPFDSFGGIDGFAEALALRDGIAFVAAALDDTMGHNAGAVYRFDAATGALLGTSFEPTPGDFDLFGVAIALAGGELLVGAPRGFVPPVTAAAVYRLDPATGALLGVVPSPTFPAGFGSDITTLGTDVLIGSPFQAPVADIYLFDAAFALVRTFSRPTTNGSINPSLAAAGNLLVVGQPNLSGFTTDSGTINLFDVTTGAPLRTISDPTPGDPGFFGWAVAIAGERLVVGAPEDTVAFAAGSLYAFCGGAAGCGPCQTCGPLGTCITAPHAGCRPLPSGRMRLPAEEQLDRRA